MTGDGTRDRNPAVSAGASSMRPGVRRRRQSPPWIDVPYSIRSPNTQPYLPVLVTCPQEAQASVACDSSGAPQEGQCADCKAVS